MTQNKTTPYLPLLIGIPIICWAFAFPLIRYSLQELSPISLTILRLLLTCIIFLIIIAAQPKRFKPIQKHDIIPLFILGFMGLIIYHLALNYGEQYISASAASLIIATIPIFVALLAKLFLKEPLTPKIILGITLSFLGVIIISLFGTTNTTIEIQYLSAAAAVLIAAIMAAGYTIAGKKMLTRYTPLQLTVYAFLLGTLGLIPFLSPQLITELQTLSTTIWLAVFILALFPTVIGYVLWYVVLKIKTASELSIYLYIIPILATIISYFWLQEPITWFFILGGALVIIGLRIVNKQTTALKTSMKKCCLPKPSFFSNF